MPRGLTKLDRVFLFIVYGLVAIVVLPLIVISVVAALANPVVILGVLLVLWWLGNRRARKARRRVPADDPGEPRPRRPGRRAGNEVT